MAESPVNARRRTFAPVAALGVLSAVLAAVAGSKVWIGELTTPAAHSAMGTASGLGWRGGEAPAALACALVVLAAWGLVVFLRGTLRRLGAWTALLGSFGLVAAVVHGRLTLADSVRDRLDGLPAGLEVDLGWSPWPYAAAGAALGCLIASALAVAWSRTWPEMGSRYDAAASTAATGRPGATGATGTEEAEDPGNLDLWKALDEGRDPTG